MSQRKKRQKSASSTGARLTTIDSKTEYRQLHKSTLAQADEIVNIKSGKFGEVLSATNDLHLKAIDGQAGKVSGNLLLLDHKQLSTLATLGAKQSRLVERSLVTTFTPADFIQSMTNKFMGGGDQDAVMDWAALGKLCAPYLKRLPALSFMNGPITVEYVPKSRKQGVRQKIKDADPHVTPREGGADKEERTMTDGRVAGLQKQIADRLGPPGTPGENDDMSLFEFIVNPHSYTETVENLYDLSSCVKLGHATIYEGTDDQLMIGAKSQEEPRNEGAAGGQFVLAMNKRNWEDIVTEWNLTKSFLPQRGDGALPTCEDDEEDEED
jgi:hypothetical protein